MEELIRVHIVKPRKHGNWLMRYVDPGTGRQLSMTAATKNKKEALKKAAKWEDELQSGRFRRNSRMAWPDFRDEFEQATSPTQRRSTFANYASALNAFERHCRPKKLAHLNADKVRAFTRELRRPRKIRKKNGEEAVRILSEASVARHLRHLKAVANWAKRQGWLPVVPPFEMPKRRDAQRMKGRPITAEEFERMLAVTPKVVGAKAAESWQFLLRGLWATGLRLGEAMALRWDHQQGGVSVDLDGKHSVLIFDAEAQKSNRYEEVPLAPEAVRLLEPFRKTAGFVFNPRAIRGDRLMARHALKIGKLIAKIGSEAGVVTDPEKGRTASAHDLRRSFGARWSKKVMPPDLMLLMRHADINTTMTYYVRHKAKTVAASLWSASGPELGEPEGEHRPKEGAEGAREGEKPRENKHTPEDSNLQPSDS